MNKEEGEYRENEEMKRDKGSWVEWRRSKRKKIKKRIGKVMEKKNKEGSEMNEEEKDEYKTVIFIQQTKDGVLANRIREKLKLIEESGGKIRIKLVERAGDKIIDLLHRSDPWDDRDCERHDCVLCACAGEKEKKGTCKKRNIVYETFCVDCGLKGDNENDKEKDNDNNKKGEYKYKYIGETNRSGYERGKEHWDQKRNFSEKSHILKHCLIHHKEKNPEEVVFGMKIRKQYKTALERQIGEAVAILEEKEKGTELMNSKSEFNRCSLPRITADDSKELLEMLKEDDEADKEIKASIRCMRKRKKKEKEEEKRRKETLEELCDKYIEENKMKWKRRRIEEERKKTVVEREIEIRMEDEKKENREKRERLEKAKRREKNS